ncbi:MAG: hypothetical protein KDB00_04685, partial [Planctomycetales bacterium]|nr:hypothetical protein [Planctomycetales bacterium]
MNSRPINSNRSDGANAAPNNAIGYSSAPMDAPVSTSNDNWMTHRLGRWLDGKTLATVIGRIWNRNHQTASPPSCFVPRLTSLEPRIVLNATAELSAASGLLIFGDSSDDVVHLNSIGGGDFLQLTDGNGSIISITGHTGGATGNETDPLAMSDISGGNVQIDLGAGNDTLTIDLVDGINLNVIDGSGDDRTEVDVQPATSPSPATSVSIDSETIDLAPSGSLIQFADRDVTFVGDVRFGTGNPTGMTEVDIGDGALTIDGTVRFDGTLRFVGGSGDVDLRDAVVSASSSQAKLFFEFDASAGSNLELGQIDDSGGSLIDELGIVSSTQSTLYGDVEINGSLSIDSMDHVDLHGNLVAGTIDVSSNNISTFGTVSSNAGAIVIVAGDHLSIDADIDSSEAGIIGAVTLGGSNGSLNGISIVTAGGNIRINGALDIVGDVHFDTAMGTSASSGGDVTWIGPATSDGALAAGQLSIDTIGVTDKGNVNFIGDIGGASATSPENLQSLAITAGSVSVRAVSVDGSSIDIDADQINVFGASIRASDQSGLGGGNIHFTGATVFHLMNTNLISSGELILDGNIGTLGPDDDLAIVSGGSTQLLGVLSGGRNLSIDAQSLLQLQSDLLNWTTIELTADAGIEITSAQITSTGSIVVSDAVEFQSNTMVHSDTVRFEDTVSVAANRVVQLDCILIDSVSQTEILKLGAGELVLAGVNTLTDAVVVQAGTLRVDGSLGPAADVAVQSGAVLSGSGQVLGALTVNGGTIAPNEVTPSSQTGQLRFGSMVLSPDAIFEINVDGQQVGQSLDSIAITDQPIDIAGAILHLDLSVTLPGDTELLIVQNDSSGQIAGRFFADFDENGNPLANPRELVEGALVLNQFGPGGSALPAYITYFGGDGNDVTIVTAGDRVQSDGNVTVITRSGVNLHIRSGNSFADAQNAVPIIRPIAGLNGRTLSIDAIAAGAELYIDVDGFVDVGPNPLHFDADIVFDTSAVGGNAQVTLYDSVHSSVDSPDQFEVEYISADEAIYTVNHADAVAPDYRILTTDVRHVDVQTTARALLIELTDSDDELIVNSDTDPDFAGISIETASVTNELRIRQPQEILNIDGRDGDDVLMFSSFGMNLIAVPTVVGGNGNDQVTWNADVTVGENSAMRDMTIQAEAISIGGDIRLVGGGNVQVVASDQLDVTSTIDATTGQLIFDSGAVSSDLSSAQLFSSATGSAISLHGGDYLIGDITAVSGTVHLGTAIGLGTIGSVRQAAGTSIDALLVTADSTGLLELGSSLNQIVEAELVAADAVMVLDSSDDLTVSVSSGSSVDIQTAGDLYIDFVYSSGADARLFAAGNILGQPGQTNVHVAAENVELLSGTQYPGLSNMPGTVASIGSALVPIRIAAAQTLSATTSGTNGSIFIASPAVSGLPFSTGSLPIGLIDAGAGRIEIDAVSIDDAYAVADVDLIAAAIRLNADLGIGGSQTLAVSGVADLEAVTGSGVIKIDVISDRNVNLSRVVNDGGTGDAILIQHFGEHRLSITNVENANGDINIVTETSSIDVLQNVSGNSLSAAADGNINLQTLGGQSDISVRGEVSSDSGDVTIAATRNLVFTPTGSLNSADGNVSLIAGNPAVNATTVSSSTIALMDGSLIDAGIGTASLTAPGNIFVSAIRSTNPAEAITVESINGELIDSGDQDTDLVADFGTVRIDVHGGIGGDNTLETQIGNLDAVVRGAGDLRIDEASAINLVDVDTFDGLIEIVAEGTIVVDRLVSQNASQIDGLAHHDIHLTATGDTSDILVRSLVGQGVTDVELIVGDDVLKFGNDSLLLADDLAITSFNRTSDSANAVNLRTDVNDLELTVLGAARGDVQIDEINSIRLASSDRNDDTEVVSTTNGEIRINAAGKIVVDDTSTINDGASLRNDVEIVAGGQNGRIRLAATESIRLGDLVQIHAQQTQIASVTIDSAEIVFGEGFQIETGDGIGVARVFATRPDHDLSGTAFYDASTVSTNRLEQAAVNDATGILTVDIGNDGERGLTINIDWGASSNRFQQIDLLSGDADPLQ